MCVECAWARLHEVRLDKMDHLQGVDFGFAQRLCRVVHSVLSYFPDHLGDNGHKGACSETRDKSPDGIDDCVQASEPESLSAQCLFPSRTAQAMLQFCGYPRESRVHVVREAGKSRLASNFTLDLE